jgi:hypothetical protein
MGGFFSLFKRQSQNHNTAPSVRENVLPSPGGSVSCLLSFNEETVHTICRVEERKGSALMLRVLREIGKVSLAGLRTGALGQLETSAQVLPLRIEQVQLPWIAVTAFPERARPVLRQSLRVPAVFTVRFRRQVRNSHWLTGRGINLSTGGFCCALQTIEPLKLGSQYFAELTIKLTRTQKIVLTMGTEVRWIATLKGETTVGLCVIDPARCKDLANIVSQLQHQLVRKPEDYVLVENAQPHLQ